MEQGRIRKGGIGQIEEGQLKGRHFIIPNIVLVRKGTHASGAAEFSLACLIHEKFIPSNGCAECDEEVAAEQQQQKAVGLA